MYLFHLADTLGIAVRESSPGVINGAKDVRLKINDVFVRMTVQIVSSVRGPDGLVVLARLKGNLACAVLLEVDRNTACSLLLLDLIKLGKPIERLCEDNGLHTVAKAVEYLTPATLRIYHKNYKNVWRPASPVVL